MFPSAMRTMLFAKSAATAISPLSQMRVRTFADSTTFKPAVRALARRRETMGVQPPPVSAPTPAAPREGASALTKGFGGVARQTPRAGGNPRMGSGSRLPPGVKKATPKRALGSTGSKDMTKATSLSESTGLFTRIITVGRVSRMTGQGRKQQFRALVVIGNGNGAAGFGVGKGLNPKSALASAIREGEKDLVFIDAAPWGSLYHDVEGSCNNTKVVIRAIESHKWYATAGRLMKIIMNAAGVTSYCCYVTGRRNPFTVVQAAFDALGHHKTPKEIAYGRGRKLIDKNNPDLFSSDKVH